MIDEPPWRGTLVDRNVAVLKPSQSVQKKTEKDLRMEASWKRYLHDQNEQEKRYAVSGTDSDDNDLIRMKQLRDEINGLQLKNQGKRVLKESLQ